MNSQNQDTKNPSPPVGKYVANQGSPDDEAKAQKFILTESLSEDIKWLSDAEHLNKTEIVKKALDAYFLRSHYWNNKRFFLERASETKIDLSEANTATQVKVMWCNEKSDPLDKSAFVACRILDIDGDNILINPLYYLPMSMANDAALIKKSEVVVPGFIDFDPNNVYNLAPPFLNQLTYQIPSKYIWSIT